MKTYTVIRSTSGAEVGCTVVDENFAGARLVKHVVLHSLTGFETGYAGSGPADLALSILANYYEVSDGQIAAAISCWHLHNVGGGDAERALLFHQAFKLKFIAPQQLKPGQAYEIPSSAIESWLADLLGGARQQNAAGREVGAL